MVSSALLLSSPVVPLISSFGNSVQHLLRVYCILLLFYLQRIGRLNKILSRQFTPLLMSKLENLSPFIYRTNNSFIVKFLFFGCWSECLRNENFKNSKTNNSVKKDQAALPGYYVTEPHARHQQSVWIRYKKQIHPKPGKGYSLQRLWVAPTVLINRFPAWAPLFLYYWQGLLSFQYK